MADPKSIEEREQRAAVRAIGRGYVVQKIVGREDFPYVLATESGLTLDQLEELIDEIDGGAS